MTLDDHTLELIHGEIDGALDAAGRVELKRLIESHPAARREHDELRRLHAELAAVEPLEPPVGLKTAIMAGLGEAGGAHGRARARWFAAITGNAGLRAAALAAAALVVVAFAWPMLTDGEPVDPAAARGTIGASVAAEIAFDGVAGSVRLAPAGAGRWTAEIEIEADVPSRLEIGTGAASMVEAGVLEGDPAALRHDGERLSWDVVRNGRLRLTLAAEGSTTLELNGIRDGAAIGSLRVPIGSR